MFFILQLARYSSHSVPASSSVVLHYSKFAFLFCPRTCILPSRSIATMRICVFKLISSITIPNLPLCLFSGLLGVLASVTCPPRRRNLQEYYIPYAIRPLFKDLVYPYRSQVAGRFWVVLLTRFGDSIRLLSSFQTSVHRPRFLRSRVATKYGAQDSI